MKSLKEHLLLAMLAIGTMMLISSCNTRMKTEQATDSVIVNDEMQPVDTASTDVDTTAVDTTTVIP